MGDYLLALANMLLNNRGYSESWRLQYLTDLKVLPDYDDGWGYYRQSTGAPVDADGKPVFYYVPKSFEAAENDGQRWRWCLQQAVEMDPQRLNSVRMQFAEFLLNQFGVQTMAQWGWRIRTHGDRRHEGGRERHVCPAHPGRKRDHRPAGHRHQAFKLPDEFNYIKIFQQIADETSTRYGAVEALEHLAQIFENRRQYPKAADYWRRLLKDYPQEDSTAARVGSSSSIRSWAIGAASSRRRPSPPAAAPRSSIASATAGRSSSPPTKSRSKSCWTT